MLKNIENMHERVRAVINHIISYIKYLEKTHGLRISIHYSRKYLYILGIPEFSVLTDYNFHSSPFCIKTKRKEEYLTAFLFTAPDGRIALTKREEKGLLAGLYALPTASGTLTEADAATAAEALGAKPERLVSALQYDHVFTHITWHVTCYRFEVAPPGENAPFLFAKPGEYALPTAFMKGLKLM